MTHWTESALCAQTDPALFFPEKFDTGAARRAKTICDACEVRAECAAEVRPHDLGIWGGLTSRQRKAAAAS